MIDSQWLDLYGLDIHTVCVRVANYPPVPSDATWMGLLSPSEHSTIVSARVYANAAEAELRSRYARSDHPVPGMGRRTRRVSEARFERLIAQYGDDVVFIHAGLSDVSRAFDRNPYNYLREVLTEHFESVLVPGFTASFRDSGVYHKQYSRPEFGAFAREFLADADYRTNDAIHSILVKGPYRFDDCDHQDSFGPNSCWAKLDDENVLYCNIGTPWIVSTQHHYLEHRMDVPYNHPTEYEGVIYYDERTSDPWIQRNYRYDFPAKRSAKKIEQHLKKLGVLDHYNLDGLALNFFRAADLRQALLPKIESDPYYLIT